MDLVKEAGKDRHNHRGTGGEEFMLDQNHTNLYERRKRTKRRDRADMRNIEERTECEAQEEPGRGT